MVSRLIERPLAFIAAHTALSLLLPALLCLTLAWLYVVPFGFPAPRIKDEFSYLLGSDTFASGRVANPTHPLWVYFESPHINHVPSYVSMYHPAQALVLAAGQRLAGHPWYGVLASVVIMCVAITWMLRMWLPPQWAVLGAFVAVQIGVFGNWVNWDGYWVASYWGGAVAATAGAMVLGALGQLRHRLRVYHSVMFAGGVAILANSRPYEGVVLTTTAIGVLLLAWRRAGFPARLLLRKFVLPVTAIAVLTCAAMAYYCWRTTGNPVRLPYQENMRQYGIRRMFLWGENTPKVYRHVVLEKLYRYLLREHLSYKRKALDTIKRITRFYLGPVLLAPLLMLFWVVRDRRIRPLLICCVVVLAGIIFLEWVNIHYVAPLTGAFIAVIIQCLRHVATFRPRGFPVGKTAALFVVGASFLFTAADAWASRGWHRSGWAGQRDSIQQELVRGGGKHLIIVRYSDQHQPQTSEWVYNAADIDGSPVVWAREMSDNAPLLKYFAGRRVWLLEVDSYLFKLKPYPSQ